MGIYSILEKPWAYSLIQFVFGIGGKKLKEKMIRDLTENFPLTDRVLDVGCGPRTPFQMLGSVPIGADLNDQYIREYRNTTGADGIVCSAETLPFNNSSFDSVWSRGLYHHLPDTIARQGVIEMCRVCRDDGYVIILDAVLPRSSIIKPLAYLIRKMDRGSFMRDQESIESLLPERESWQIKRYVYNHITRVEMLICVYQKVRYNESAENCNEK